MHGFISANSKHALNELRQSFMIAYYSVNGKLVPKEQAVLNVTDLAILRGYGLFDFFIVKQGKPLFFDDYLDRFEYSAKQLQLTVPYSRKELKQQILQVIEANRLESAGLKLVLTGGYSEDGFAPSVPNLVILASPPPNYPPSYYEDGIKLLLHEYQRALANVKSINYIIGVYLLPQMRAAGAIDVLFHYNGFVHETTRANFFLVKDDQTIVTPGEGILKGITRNKTLEIARKYYKVEERNVRLQEISEASEAFISSSTRQLMPVVKVDEIVIGEGRPGPVTQKLLELLKAEERKYLAEPIQV